MNLALHFGLSRGALALAIDLEVCAGETLAVVGPNGAGKSTCLQAIAGVLPIERGRIAVGEQVLDGGPGSPFVPAERRGIGYLFQEPLLFPHMSALDNVAFGLRAQGTSRAEARHEAATWLARVDLAGIGSSFPHALSGGQAQRVALARVLATQPRVLLLDEPLAAVDASTRQRLRAELRTHLRSFAGPRILVTHDVTDALALGDRIAVIEAGAIVQQGTPAEIGSRPKSRYTADLIGLNCFRGTVADGLFMLENGARLVVVSDHRGAAIATAHPRSVALFLERPLGSPRNCWQAEVLAVEPALDSVRLQLGGEVPIVAEVTAGSVEGLGLHVGSRVWVAIKATEIRVVGE